MARDTPFSSPGVQLADLSAFTDAYGTNKKLGTRKKNIMKNFPEYAGTLGPPQSKDYSKNKKTGSAQFAEFDNNPDPRDERWYKEARTFITPDESGFTPADEAYAKWEGFARNEFDPSDKNNPFSSRFDVDDIMRHNNTYWSSKLVSDEDFVNKDRLYFMQTEPATEGSTESNSNEVNKFPSQGVDV
tara:strand:- start:730 stop:1290 length:561 start_codon:yes stop_codon:yes gene_type:complete